MANTPKGGSEKPPTNQPKKTETSATTKHTPGKGSHSHSTQHMTSRQLTRYERDRRNQRYLILTGVITVVLMVLILVFGVFQSTIAPNIKELASVNGQSVTTGDYYKFRKLTLFKRIAQYQQFMASLAGDQQQQFQQQIQSFSAEIDDTPSYPVDQQTLSDYISILVLDKAARDQYGINPSDDDVKKAMDSQFGTELRLSTPTPSSFGAVATPTLAALGTAIAAQNTATANVITPLPTATPSVSASPSPTPTTIAPTNTAVASGTPSASGTAVPSGTPATATPAPTNTALPADKAQQTLGASQNSFFDSVKKVTGLSMDEYKKLEIRPRLLKDLVSDKLLAAQPKLGDPVLQLHARAISVKEKVEAEDLLKQLKAVSGADRAALFTKLAREKSIDTVAAPKNGDLGWFMKYQLSSSATEDTAWDALLKLQPGDLTDPLQVSEGWQILILVERNDTRAIDEREYQSLFDTDQNGDYRVYARWLQQKIDDAKPKYFTAPTPTSEPTQVLPPVFTPVVQPSATPNTAAQTPVTTNVVGPLPISGTATANPVTTTAATTTTSGTTTVGSSITPTVTPVTTASGAALPTPTK
ncbi:MAG: peptidylprolyl isomerase [Chloroflexi bacterium]|uniref:Peptidylprolyl isomerase n=1 Tax=Candidatus Chlorohelix allophototropha TaxID=3003348 RepID=A0A8T7LXZ1_9CHLR|nr:peptidylprolyl isomerase [Chloroflexota bacterium]WJW67634.1 peptidylprolyl isomerase [Chloroflexota bacterium L227-S17]